MQKDIIERALELARSGEFKGAEQIKAVLSKEGYTAVHQHFAGVTVRRIIQIACHAARGVPVRASSPKTKKPFVSKLPRSMRER
jgi:hypothetical protein